MPLSADYEERVYAGVLGKLVGVYLGRPFEGWTHERITGELGEIDYYVNDRFGVPLVVPDDDVTGTFTFLRALEDHGFRRDLTAREVGRSWLDYIVEGRTILWWGGNGVSTEHTAWLNLKRGIEAPASGAIETNGRLVAEQIGAQIFIDGWGMVAPGDPDLAARLAGEAARVIHDGDDVLVRRYGPGAELAPGGDAELTRRVPDQDGMPVAELEVEPARPRRRPRTVRPRRRRRALPRRKRRAARRGGAAHGAVGGGASARRAEGQRLGISTPGRGASSCWRAVRMPASARGSR